MGNLFTMDLFSDPFFIGFNRELDRFAHIHEAASKQSYPPYNIVKENDDTYKVSIAVAGFDKDDVEVSVDNGTLIVKGEKADEDTAEYLHRGIATRKFVRTFALGEFMEVVGAKMDAGMLTIEVERIVPEEKKPKTIRIK